MLRKMMLFIALTISVGILTGCDLFGSKPKPVDDIKTVAVSYDEFKLAYNKDSFNLLPESIHNDELVTTYNSLDINTLVEEIQRYSNIGNGYQTLSQTDKYYPSYLSYETTIIEENNPVLSKELYNKSDLEVLDFGNIYDVSNNTASGPLDFVYGNVASVNLYLDLFQQLETEFAKYGEIQFDGRVITIPGTSSYPNPIDPYDQITPADIKGKFYQANGRTIIAISCEQTETISQAGNNVTVTAGVYLKMAVGKTENNLYVTDMTFHFVLNGTVNGDLDGDGRNEVGTMNLGVGNYVRVIENTKLVMNGEIGGEVHMNFSNNSMSDINENYKVNSTFTLNSGDTTEVIFKVKQNALDTFDLNYYIQADDQKALVYTGFNIGDPDFNSETVPSEKLAGIAVYNNNNEVEFVAGAIDINSVEYNYDYINDIYTEETINRKYNGYAFNLRTLDGWTKMEIYMGSNQEFQNMHELYNNDTLIFGENDFISTYDDAKNVIEGKATGGITINNEFDLGLFVHVSKNPIDISLPSQLTSANLPFIRDAYNNYIKTDKTGDNFGVDFNNNAYKVPALDKSQY